MTKSRADGSNVRLSLVTATFAPSFSSSFFKANSLSVSFIFRVCKPVRLQPIPNPKQVTAMVWAMSGEEFN